MPAGEGDGLAAVMGVAVTDEHVQEVDGEHRFVAGPGRQAARRALGAAGRVGVDAVLDAVAPRVPAQRASVGGVVVGGEPDRAPLGGECCEPIERAAERLGRRVAMAR